MSIRDTEKYHRTRMQKELIIRRLKERGCRITRQRMMLMDIILEEECTSCKEIYFKAASMNGKIGVATVYRMINTLEEIGAISRRNMYRVICGGEAGGENACIIELDDGTVIELTEKNLHQIIQSGLRANGYLDGQNVLSVMTGQAKP